MSISSFLILSALIANFFEIASGLNYGLNSATLVGASTKTSTATKIKFLSNGDFIVGGYSNGAIGGQTNVGNYDFVIQRYSSAGTLTWTRQWGSTGSDQLYGLFIDKSDNIYASGFCSGTVDSFTSAGGEDCCFVKYDSNGNKLFSGQFGNSGTDECNAVVVDNSNTYFYLLGQTTSSPWDGYNRLGSSAATWLKYDTATGTKQASYLYKEQGNNYVYGATIDTADNIYTVAGGSGTTLFGNTGFGSYDAVLTKFNSSSTMKWSARAGGSSNDYFYDVVLDSSNNIYAVGYTASSTVNSVATNGGQDILFMKFDSTGSPLYTILAGGSLNDQALGIALDEANSRVYLTGFSKSTFYGNNDGTSAGSGTTMMLIYDTNGTRIYSNLYPSSSSDNGNSILVKDPQTIYIAGFSSGSYSGATLTGSQDMSILGVGPAGSPTETPTQAPTLPPGSSQYPTFAPTLSPTAVPTLSPSYAPTLSPTFTPTVTPTAVPTSVPSTLPTSMPSSVPSSAPTQEGDSGHPHRLTRGVVGMLSFVLPFIVFCAILIGICCCCLPQEYQPTSTNEETNRNSGAEVIINTDKEPAVELTPV